MFGYVRPHKSELLVREYEQYKSVYCQLCRELGKSFGIASRFTLSYDCTFYALLALSVSGAKATYRQGRCVVNPMKKCGFIESPGEEYKKAAALSILLTYHKLKDNIEDEGFGKSLLCRLLLPFVSRKAKKAKALYPQFAEPVETMMREQHEAEQAETVSVDRCAEPSARMLSAVCGELGGCSETQRMVLSRFGYFLGRWIYLMDAADDLTEDLKKGSFNPFIPRLGLEGKRELTEEERSRAEEACNETLNANVAQMLPALNLVEMEGFAPIVENVIQKGLPEIQREILFLHIKDRRRSKELKKL